MRLPIKIQTNAVTPINGRTFPPHNILKISKLAVENAHRNGRREVLEEDIHEALRVFDGD